MWRSEAKSGKLCKEGEVTLSLIVYCCTRLSVGMMLRLINTKSQRLIWRSSRWAINYTPRLSKFSFIFLLWLAWWLLCISWSVPAQTWMRWRPQLNSISPISSFSILLPPPSPTCFFLSLIISSWQMSSQPGLPQAARDSQHNSLEDNQLPPSPKVHKYSQKIRRQALKAC